MAHLAGTKLDTFVALKERLGYNFLTENLFRYESGCEENEDLQFLIHGETTPNIRDLTLIGKAKVFYSKLPFDPVLFHDHKIALIDNSGIWMSKNKNLAENLKKRRLEYIKNLPAIDGQEVLPVFSMISNLSISPDIISGYLDGFNDVDTHPPSLSRSERSELSLTDMDTIIREFSYSRIKDLELDLKSLDVEFWQNLKISDIFGVPWRYGSDLGRKIAGHVNKKGKNYPIINKTGKFIEKVTEPIKTMFLADAMPYVPYDTEELFLNWVVAYGYLRSGRFNEALPFFEKVISTNGNFEKMLATYDIDLDKHTSALSNIRDYGYSLLCCGRTREAIRVLNMGLDIMPPSNLHNYLGIAFQIEGNYSESLNHYKKELEVNPQHPTASRSIRRIESLERLL